MGHRSPAQGEVAGGPVLTPRWLFGLALGSGGVTGRSSGRSGVVRRGPSLGHRSPAQAEVPGGPVLAVAPGLGMVVFLSPLQPWKGSPLIHNAQGGSKGRGTVISALPAACILPPAGSEQRDAEEDEQREEAAARQAGPRQLSSHSLPLLVCWQRRCPPHWARPSPAPPDVLPAAAATIYSALTGGLSGRSISSTLPSFNTNMAPGDPNGPLHPIFLPPSTTGDRWYDPHGAGAEAAAESGVVTSAAIFTAGGAVQGAEDFIHNIIIICIIDFI